MNNYKCQSSTKQRIFPPEPIKMLSTKSNSMLRRRPSASDIHSDNRITSSHASPMVIRRFNFRQQKLDETIQQRKAFEKKISRSNFSLANLDTSPRNSRIFIPDFPSPSSTFEQQHSVFNSSLQSASKNYASQTISGVHARLMNSNDSLNNDHQQQQMSSRGFRPQDQQQPHPNDINEVSRSFAPPMLSSPAVTRREFVPQNGYMSAVPQPQHGKMLIDPQTGQQYFVATNSQPQQVAYYSVFYGAAAPPPPIQQHVYYAHPPQPQWLNGPMPSPPVVGNSHQGNFFAQHHYSPHHQPGHYPPTTSNNSYAPAYHVEVPPSSSVSVCDDRANSPYFQRNHESRMSTESTTSGQQHFQPAQFHSDDSMSPIPPRIIPRNASSTATSNSATTISQTNPSMEQSARYSTTSSTTSGFVSGAGESTIDTSLNRPTRATAFNRPKLYGAPEWWGEESSPEIESNKPKVENTYKKLESPTGSKTLAETIERNESPNEPKAAIAKAIRMDIDLSRPLTPEQKKAISNDQKASNRAPPTAFTVNFDDSENNSARRVKPPVLTSQQDGPNPKRNNRRSVPPARPQLPQNNSKQDPKHYLFSKMIQGYPSSNLPFETSNEDDDQHTTILSLGDRRNDIDAISEAGTYTIEDKNKFRRNDRRQFSDVSSTSSASSSTATNKSVSHPHQVQQPMSARSNTTTVVPESSSSALSSARSNASTASPHFAMRRSLMKDLRDLRDQQLAKPQTPTGQPKARTIVDPLKSSRLGSASSNQRQQPAPSNPSPRVNTSSASSNSGFRVSPRCLSETRSDGGRFSMRSNAPAPNTPNNNKFSGTKPPFRAGIAPPSKKNQIAAGTPEMANWLRRKGYDPRKSVAEERKMQHLKERSETFFANRSVSYNQPYYSGFRKLLRPIDDESSNISHSQDDLRLKEESEDFSMNGSNSNLSQTVDELTQKCQRSMQLLKLCNPNALTESVEHLLDQIVDDSSEEGDSAAIGRLGRLNDAFGALQKCLEESTTSSRNSSVSAAIKQRILSPTTSAPTSLISNSGLSVRRDDSPEEF